jgi:hypothetical protein
MAICGEWSESKAEKSERIDAALRHMVAREEDGISKQDRPARYYSLREIADYVGCDPTVIMRIEQAALATIREKTVKFKPA